MASRSRAGSNLGRKQNSSDRDKTSFYPLRMTANHKTEMYVKFAKVMVIFQGSVTTERSKAVEDLASAFKYAGRVISDRTYEKATSHVAFLGQLDDFNSYCTDRVKKSFEEGYNLIVIDQSVTNPLQMKNYCYLAQVNQYVVVPYPPLVKRYSPDDVNNQAKKFSDFAKCCVDRPNHFKHLFCGWFLHDVDSFELRGEASLYVQDCFDSIPDFKDMFSGICRSCDFREYYNMLDKRQDLAFCTIKIFQNPLVDRDYMSTNDFKKYYGNMSKLYIVGFVISPHIIAARVKLTKDQRNLWEMPDELDEKNKPTLFPSQLLERSKVQLPKNKEDVTLIASKSNRTIISGNTIYEPTKVFHPRAIGRSCHIVLGKVKDAPLLNSNYDVQLAVTREMNVVQKYSDDVRPYDLDRCQVRRIGKYWFIYLKETLVVDGLFASCCALEGN